MDLSKILTISGKSGLFKVVSQSKGGLIVESLTDGKRIPVFLSDRSSALGDISIFSLTEDIPLKQVLLKIFEKEAGKPCIDPKEEASKLIAYFETILPDFDRQRVYISDIKKVYAWYNILLEKQMISPEEVSEPEGKAEISEADEAVEENVKAVAKRGPAKGKTKE